MSPSTSSPIHSISTITATKSHFTPTRNDRLADIEDIPIILDRDFDPFMIIHSCRSDKEKLRMQTQLTVLRRPKVQRLKARSVGSSQEATGGLRANFSRLRPVSSYGTKKLPANACMFVHTPRKTVDDSAPVQVEELETELPRLKPVVGTGSRASRSSPRQLGARSKSSLIRMAPAEGGGRRDSNKPSGSSPMNEELDEDDDQGLGLGLGRSKAGEWRTNDPKVLFGSSRLPSSKSFANAIHSRDEYDQY
jgi:hypothetical protein